jgi:hypothetical protein
MAELIALPTEEGLGILKQALYEQIKKFSLIDENDNAYYTAPVHSVYFDDRGVLTVSCIVPVEEHFTVWNKAIQIETEDGTPIARVETPGIQFVKGVGGEIPVKLAVSGEPATIVFKSEDYITPAEARELFLTPLVEVSKRLTSLELLLINKGIIYSGG